MKIIIEAINKFRWLSILSLLAFTACSNNQAESSKSVAADTCFVKNLSVIEKLYDTHSEVIFSETGEYRSDDGFNISTVKSVGREIGLITPNAKHSISSDMHWKPSIKELKKVDEKFDAYVALCPPSHLETIEEPKQSDKQVYGIILDDKKYLFINGFPPDITVGKISRRKKFPTSYVFILDGGPSFYRAIYDVEGQRYIWIEYNGYA